ncbi:MAG: hypothetical protein HYT87_07485 [Nitrospirae bacterium]|nr:hypothetical protein [Nitrospirota bacterium]
MAKPSGKRKKKGRPIPLAKIIAASGRTIATGGQFVGHKIAEWYGKVDPDVSRHLLQVPLLSYSLFSSRQEEVEPGEPDGHPPLILVYGLGGNRGNFLLMSWYLRIYGRKRIYRVAFNPEQTIRQRATALGKFIEKVADANHESQVDVVAHSLGGVVARLAVSREKTAKRVHTLITLGAPHGGTYPARFANTKITKDLRPDSPLMRGLRRQPWPRRVRGVTLWSKNDLFVLPPESATLQGTKKIDMTPFTHYSYLIEPKSWETVRRELGRPNGARKEL